jgi:hypothetical protein
MHREKSRAETIMFRCVTPFFPSASKNEEMISWKVLTWCEMTQIIRSDKMMFDNIEHISQYSTQHTIPDARIPEPLCGGQLHTKHLRRLGGFGRNLCPPCAPIWPMRMLYKRNETPKSRRRRRSGDHCRSTSPGSIIVMWPQVNSPFFSVLEIRQSLSAHYYKKRLTIAGCLSAH